MGVTVRQKQPGKGKAWWIFIRHNGKRKSKRIGDRNAAEQVASTIRQKLNVGDLELESAKKSSALFRVYAMEWLNTHAATACKYSTYKSYESCLGKHLIPFFGDQALEDIHRRDVKRFIYKKLAEGLASSTVNNARLCVSGIFTAAIEDELVEANPAARTGKFTKRKDRRQDVNPLTREEAKLFLDAAWVHYPRYYPLFLCALRTGMRMGELIGLKWGDIDFNGQFIEVRQSIVRCRSTSPKNHRTRRVDMSNQLTETLRNLKVERKKETLKRGWKEVPELVFCSEKGDHLDTDNLRKRVFHKCLEKAGLRRIRFHDLRHTYASILLAQKESPAYVQEQLGHASIQLTVDTYGHLVPGSNRSAVDKLDDLSAHPVAPPAHPAEKKGLTSSANPLELLVAGAGFEPTTFGL